jgi:hypothetical protein
MKKHSRAPTLAAKMNCIKMQDLSVLDDWPKTLASFSFIENLPLYDHEKPYYLNCDLPAEQEQFRTNLRYVKVDQIPVSDVRGCEQILSLEEHGIEVAKFRPDTLLTAPWAELPIEPYLREVAQWLKSKLGAHSVLPYNYKVFSLILCTKYDND